MTYVLQVDDEDDLETIAQLIDPNPPQGFLVSATEKLIFGSLPYVPKKNIQMFTQVYRYRIPNNTPPSSFNKLFYRVVQVSWVDLLSGGCWMYRIGCLSLGNFPATFFRVYI